MKHWQTVGIVTLILVVVTAAVLLIVLLPGSDSASSDDGTITIPSQSPGALNGDSVSDVAAPTFGNPQRIANPNPTLDTQFAARLFVHNAGYLAVSAREIVSGAPVMYFFFTSTEGSISGSQRVVLDFLPDGMVICNGSFAPIFNRVNEVYYLFLSVGYPGVGVDQINLYATNVILFVLDTSATTATWSLSSIQSSFTVDLRSSKNPDLTVKALKIPAINFVWDRQKPYIGTFGDHLQAVINAGTGSPFHGLYVGGSQYSPSAPGGSVYWLSLSDNSLVPAITARVVQIQDSKLYQLRAQWLTGKSETNEDCKGKLPPTENVDDRNAYVHGFGASFYVSSGSGRKSALLVSNQTSQDYCPVVGANTSAASPNGYIQGFTYNNDNPLLWQQSGGDTGFDYEYRYPSGADPDFNNLFGYGLLWAQDFLITGSGSAVGSSARYPVYPWARFPVSDQRLLRKTVIETSAEGGLLSAAVPRYNHGAKVSADGQSVIVVSRSNRNNTNTISVQSARVGTEAPFAKFAEIESLGQIYNSDQVSDAPQTRLGFAQFTDTWLSRTGLTLRIAFNDPRFNNGQGRFIVMSKPRLA